MINVLDEAWLRFEVTTALIGGGTSISETTGRNSAEPDWSGD